MLDLGSFKLHVYNTNDALGDASYIIEGKTGLVIAVGCTGGRHRSVAVAKEIGDFVMKRGYPTVVNHRDIARG